MEEFGLGPPMVAATRRQIRAYLVASVCLFVLPAMPARLLAFVLCLMPIAATDAVPLVDVSLAAAAPPAGLVSAIAARDAARESLESSISASDVRAFNAALRAARPRLESLAKSIARQFNAHQSSSFLSRDVQVVDVHVPDDGALDLSVLLPKLEEFDGTASAQEAREFNARLADFTTLTAFVLREAQAASNALLARARGTAAAFVAERAAGAGASALAAMESRRDIGEQHFRARHLSLALALLQQENDMLIHALRRELGASESTGVSFLAGTPGADERYTFKLVAPTEDEREVIDALDALLLSEKARQHAKDSSFASVKQHLLHTESAEIRHAAAAAAAAA